MNTGFFNKNRFISTFLFSVLFCFFKLLFYFKHFSEPTIFCEFGL